MDASAAHLLIVDDELAICNLVRDVLAHEPLHCQLALGSQEAVALLSNHRFDVIIMDMLMPGLGGMDLLRHIVATAPNTRVICITGRPSWQGELNSLKAGAYDYIEKPFDLRRLLRAIRRAVDEPPSNHALDGGPDVSLRRMLLESAGALVRAVEAKDPYTSSHSEHVAYYADQIARHANLAGGLRNMIRLAAVLHDIGKIAMPDSVLTKPGPLTAHELALIHNHPLVGSAILENITLLKDEARLVRWHHEHWDGSGYPDGLRGESIPLGARVLCLADSMDAMLMHRTYKRAFTIDRMADELERCAGTQFDPALAHTARQWALDNPQRLILPDNCTALGIAHGDSAVAQAAN